MDEITNPFSPGAGSRPPALAGREEILHQARILLERVKQGRPEKSILLTGLRGVGKTVLLNAIERMAANTGYHTLAIEGREDQPLAPLIAQYLRKVLIALQPAPGVGAKTRQALAVLGSFISTFSVNVGDVGLKMNIAAAQGRADSGNLEIDLQELLVAAAEAAAEHHRAIAIFIDEVQYFSAPELSAILAAMHKIQQLELPLVLVGAGLPTLPAMAGDAKSYAERLISFPEIGPLSAMDTAKALREPALAAGIAFDDHSLAEIFKLTSGYPYFVQEWGSEAWVQAVSSPISLNVIERCTPQVIARLDRNFFRVRYDRLTPGEKNFLRAMAEFRSAPIYTGDLAELLKVKVSTLGPLRSKLIKKGMIYSPAHGELAYSVPLFGDFMKRAMPKPLYTET
ncbi:MAG: ATP-binding protein [Phycisphaerae bacterium]